MTPCIPCNRKGYAAKCDDGVVTKLTGGQTGGVIWISGPCDCECHIEGVEIGEFVPDETIGG